MQNHTIIPMPVQVTPSVGAFTIDGETTVGYDANTSALAAVAETLAGLLRPATGFPLPVQPNAGGQDNQFTSLFAAPTQRWATRATN